LMPKSINYFQEIVEKNFLLVGLTKNSSKTIEHEVLQLSAALKRFAALQWLIIESDSKDNTIEKLTKLQINIKNFRFLSLGVLKDTFPLRTARIAYCRNIYLDEINKNPFYKDIDYVIVADLDGMNDLITEEAFLSCWKHDVWGVCTANQRGPYYDIWPLRHKDWSPNDCWSQYEFLVHHNVSVQKSKFAAVYSRMIEIDESLNWIEVESAFGGLAVYRRDALCDVQYIGLNEDGEEMCEHLSLNEQIRAKGYRIFINPKLINTGYTRHTRRFQRNHFLKITKKLFSKYL